MAIKRIGWSAGLTLRNVGGVGMPAGKQGRRLGDGGLDIQGRSVQLAAQIEIAA